MMNELILELLYEEIPALMQVDAEEGYKEIFKKHLIKNQIKFDRIEASSTARRIFIAVFGIEETIEAKIIEFKGPKVGAPSNAIDGFCSSHNISSKDLVHKIINNQNFYIYNQSISAQNAKIILKEILPVIVAEYIWPNSMYWGDHEISAVRPLKNIMCLFNSEILDFRYGHLIANNLSSGHRFLGNKNIIVTSYNNYLHLLMENYVILKREDRANIINSQIKQILDQNNLSIKHDPKLLEEVLGLVEYPVVMLGKMDSKFLTVPSEALISSMRTHQKYFSLFNKDGAFAPYFLLVSNLKSDHPEVIVRGNEKVLAARLSDALFFYNQDSQLPLEMYLNGLKKMIFHVKLGTLYEKTLRIAKLCNHLDSENVDLHIAARLCKSDLLTEMVKEFPDLQGIMGYYYAIKEGLSDDTALIIKDHYKPISADGELPVKLAGFLSIADKLDSIIGLFLIKEIPTGSKDPYALRRAALGIIRIILAYKIEINLKELIDKSISLYEIKSEIGTLEILSFIEERLKNYFKNQFDVALLNYINLSKQSNIIITINQLTMLSDFLNTDAGRHLLKSYKRVDKIIGENSLGVEINNTLIILPQEKELLKIINITKSEIAASGDGISVLKKLECLENFNRPLEDFFENIMVKVEDINITNNRIILLNNIRVIFNNVVNFDLL